MSFPKFLGITVLSLFLSYAAFFGLYTALNPPNLPVIEASEDARWIATSQSLTDRTACKWIGICGGNHWRSSTRWFRKGKPPEQKTIQTSHSHRTDWRDAVVKPTNWTRSERLLREIPDYVFEYAPLVHLFSGEEFWPADIAKHLQHVTPCLNYTLLQSQRSNLTNPLYNLNIWEEGHNVFLTSNENPGQAPDWLKASTNVPEPSEAKPEAGIDSQSTIAWNGRMEGEYIDESAKREGWYEAGQGGSHAAIKRSTRSISRFDPAVLDVSKVAGNTRATDARDQKLSSPKSGKGGRSNAPALLITVDKGEGIIDAFWFYFYSFNQGNRVLNIRFGNHVGDWEHSMVRFQHGKPKALFLSQHTFGGAYSYEAVEKIGKRVSTFASRIATKANDRTACVIFRHWLPRHVCHTWHPPICPSPWPSTRRNRPWASLGSCPQHTCLHLRLQS